MRLLCVGVMLFLSSGLRLGCSSAEVRETKLLDQSQRPAPSWTRDDLDDDWRHDVSLAWGESLDAVRTEAEAKPVYLSDYTHRVDFEAYVLRRGLGAELQDEFDAQDTERLRAVRERLTEQLLARFERVETYWEQTRFGDDTPQYEVQVLWTLDPQRDRDLLEDVVGEVERDLGAFHARDFLPRWFSLWRERLGA